MNIIPQCQGCMKKPNELVEYVEAAKKERISPDAYCKREEGTYNPENGHFLCTPCYVKAGMPCTPRGWKCP